MKISINRRIRWGFVTGVFLLSSCNLSNEGYYSSFSISYNFNDADEGWEGDFADYPENDSVAYELDFKHTLQPIELDKDQKKKAIMLSGKNESRDLFMFMKKKLSGLRPNTTYTILFSVKVASNAPTGSLGVAPGDSVYLKAGATPQEPKKELDNNGMYRMNIDKGNQAIKGVDMINIGQVGVAATTTKFTVITRNNSSKSPFFVTTNVTGDLWLIVGTDSGYAGKTTLYYTGIDVLFNEL